MKNYLFPFLFGGIFLNANCLFAQQPANGPALANTAATAQKADHAWRMGGNTFVAGDITNRKNIFGFSSGNRPIYGQTN